MSRYNKPDDYRDWRRDIERRIREMETAPRASHTAIDTGGIVLRGDGAIYGGDGVVENFRVGKQADGTYGAVSLSGPKPPKPSPPVVHAISNGLNIAWDGGFVESDGSFAVAPLDHSRIEVHISTDIEFEPNETTLTGTIESHMTGSIERVLDKGIDYYVRFVARTLSGKASDPSDVSWGQSGKIRPEDLVDDILEGFGTTTIFRGEIEPEGALEGDLWIKAPNNVPHVYSIADGATELSWIEVRDAGVIEAISAASAAAGDAQIALDSASSASTSASNALAAAQAADAAALAAAGLAAGKGKVIYQASAPTGANAIETNLWIRTSDNKPHAYVGGTWTPVTDKAATDAATAAANAQTKANKAESDAAIAKAAADAAQSTANAAQTAAAEADAAALAASGLAAGKGKVIYQASAPSGADANAVNLWIRTSDNKPHTYVSGTWTAVTDKAATDAATAASTAQAKANKAETDAANAKTAADAAAALAAKKTINYYSDNQPVAPTGGFTVGDTWYDTNNDNMARRWNGTTWVDALLGNAAFENIDAGKVTTGELAAGRIGANSITIDKLVVSTGESIFPDPSFLDPSGWTNSSYIDGNAANGYNNRRSILIPSSSSQAGVFYGSTTPAKRMPIISGAKYRLSAFVKPGTSQTSGRVAIYIRWYSTDSTYTTSNVSNTTSLAANVWSEVSGIVTAPSNASYAVLGLYKQSGAVTTVRWSAPTVIPLVSDVLIENGSITAPKLASEINLASKIIAGSPSGSRVELDSTGLRKYATNGTDVEVSFESGEPAVFSGTVVGADIIGSTFRTGVSGNTITIDTEDYTVNNYTSSVGTIKFNPRPITRGSIYSTSYSGGGETIDNLNLDLITWANHPYPETRTSFQMTNYSGRSQIELLTDNAYIDGRRSDGTGSVRLTGDYLDLSLVLNNNPYYANAVLMYFAQNNTVRNAIRDKLLNTYSAIVRPIIVATYGDYSRLKIEQWNPSSNQWIRLNTEFDGAMIGIAQRDDGYSIPNNSWIATGYNVLVRNTHNLVAKNSSYPTSYPMPRTGWYRVEASHAFVSNPNGRRVIRIGRNGTNDIIARSESPSSSVTGYQPTVSVSTNAYLNQGDTLTVEVYQNSGSSLNLTTFGEMNQFSIEYLGSD